jgi:hypothetical protein
VAYGFEPVLSCTDKAAAVVERREWFVLVHDAHALRWMLQTVRAPFMAWSRKGLWHGHQASRYLGASLEISCVPSQNTDTREIPATTSIFDRVQIEPESEVSNRSPAQLRCCTHSAYLNEFRRRVSLLND